MLSAEVFGIHRIEMLGLSLCGIGIIFGFLIGMYDEKGVFICIMCCGDDIYFV